MTYIDVRPLTFSVSKDGAVPAFPQYGTTWRRRAVGVVAVVAFHLVLVYGLVNGLGREVVEVVQRPLTVQIVSEAKPPEEKHEIAQPKLIAPPPPYIPTPDIEVRQAPAANAISVVTTERPAAPPAAPPAAVRPQPVRSVATVDTDVACEEPEYPVMSRRLEEEGSVRLQLLVSPEGRVVQSRIAKSSGHPRLDEATVAALSKCKFKPGTADGKPTESWASLEYVWHLE